MDTGAYLYVFLFVFFVFFCIYVSSFCILWVASIVDLRVFWQPDSVTIGVELHDCCLFELNKYLLLLPPLVSQRLNTS